MNYLILYTVLLYPFVLIVQDKIKGDHNEEETCIYGVKSDGTCMTEGETMPE